MNAPTPGPSAAEVIPPLPPRLTWTVLLAGVGVCVLVALLGAGVDLMALNGQSAEMKERLEWTEPKPKVPGSEKGSDGERARLLAEIGRTTGLSSVRLGLAAVGLAGAVAGLWLRYTDYRAWLLAAAAGGLAGVGLPLHWDSIRMLVWVAATVAAVGGGLTALSPKWRRGVLAVGVLLHFAAILTATTLPETYGRPGPWVSNQASGRAFHAYKDFAYLTNAYHFYSPDPGPASKFLLLIEYEIDDPDAPPGPKRTTAEWVNLPERRTHYRDPLGLTYYRRLSITELATYSTVGTALPASWEKGAVMQRRKDNNVYAASKPASVPGAWNPTFNEMDMNQYRLPTQGVRGLVYPSYVRHIAAEYSGPRQAGGRVLVHRVVRVKMFRVEHRVSEAAQFLTYPNPDDVRAVERHQQARVGTLGGVHPFHPTTYAPFYLGEYAADGTLLNPDDPLLYWHLPVVPVQTTDATKPNYKDWMSEYAGREFNWEGRE